MIDTTIYQSLKQVNVSKDADQTKDRIRDAWMNMSAVARDEALSLAEVTKFAVARSYKLGTVTPRLALSIAQIANVSPFYLTGEVNDQQEFSEQLQHDFLIACGYEDLLKKTGAKPKKAKKTTAAVNSNPVQVQSTEPLLQAVEPITQAPEPLSPEPTLPEADQSINEMTEDDACVLLHSIFLRAKLGDAHAISVCNEIKNLLMK